MNTFKGIVTDSKKWLSDSSEYISNHPLTSAIVIFPATLFYVGLAILLKK